MTHAGDVQRPELCGVPMLRAVHGRFRMRARKPAQRHACERARAEPKPKSPLHPIRNFEVMPKMSARRHLAAQQRDAAARYLDSSQIQFTSQFFPPSGEKDCSMRAD